MPYQAALRRSGTRKNKRFDQKLNDLKSLQQTTEKYDRDKGQNFPQWREDIETMISFTCPGMETLLKEMRMKKEEINEDTYDDIIVDKRLTVKRRGGSTKRSREKFMCA